VDDLFRYKIGCPVSGTTARETAEALLRHWIRYFGAPKYLISDQGSSFASTEFGSYCDKWNIQRQFGGSDPSTPGQHTTTGVVEKAIDLLKHTMVKMNHECITDGIEPSPDELIGESCTARNCLLTYNGVVPIVGVLGASHTGELLDMDSDTCDFYNMDVSDYAERSVRLRQHAKVATLRAVTEYRIAKANHTHNQETVVVGVGSFVDIFRRLATKDLPGWRGPGVVLDMNAETGTCTVRWQGKPWLMSLRHVRPREGYITHLAALGPSTCYNTNHYVEANGVYLKRECTVTNMYSSQAALHSLMSLQDRADGSVPGKLLTFGFHYDMKRQVLQRVESKPEIAAAIYSEATHICNEFLGDFIFDGIRDGTGIVRLPPLPHVTTGILIV
jgi:hypothetical protein